MVASLTGLYRLATSALCGVYIQTGATSVTIKTTSLVTALPTELGGYLGSRRWVYGMGKVGSRLGSMAP